MIQQNNRQLNWQKTQLEWRECLTHWTGSPEDETLRHHTIVWCARGKNDYIINDMPVKLVRSSLCILPPGTRIQQPLHPGSKAVCHRIGFDLYCAVEWQDERRVYVKQGSFPVQGLVQPVSKRLLQRLESVLVQPAAVTEYTGYTGSVIRQRWLGELLELLLLEASVPLQPEGHDLWLKQTLNYIRQHYAEEVKLEQLAELAGMHPSYYSQQFRQRMHKTPTEFLSQLRMNKAKELILESKQTVREVARAVGFRDEFYFSRRFKENTGSSPTLYAKQSLGNVVSLSAPYTDHLLTLGITPCAAQEDQQMPEGIKSLSLPRHASQSWEISREAFIAVKPELIICKDNVVNQAREHVADIAPILSIPWTLQDVFGHLMQIASLLRKEQAAYDWLSGYEYRAEQARRQVADTVGGASLALCELRGEGFRMYGERNAGHVFYRALQLKPPVRIQKELNKYTPGTVFNWLSGSLEDIREYDADLLCILIKSPSDKRKAQKLMQTNPAWLQYPAVRTGRVFILEREHWIDYAPGAIDSQLQRAVKLLTLRHALHKS